MSVTLVRYDHEDLLIIGTLAAEDAPEKKTGKKYKEEEQKIEEAKDMAESCCCTSRCNVADRINEMIARYENTTATVCHPPCEPTVPKFFTIICAKHIFFALFPPLLVPLRHTVLDGPYQAAQIIPDKTFGERYVYPRPHLCQYLIRK